MAKLKKQLLALTQCAKLLGLPDAEVNYALDFLAYNEPALCFDQVVCQLDEFDVRITTDFYHLVTAIASEMKISPDGYAYLEALIDSRSDLDTDIRCQITEIIREADRRNFLAAFFQRLFY